MILFANHPVYLTKFHLFGATISSHTILILKVRFISRHLQFELIIEGAILQHKVFDLFFFWWQKKNKMKRNKSSEIFSLACVHKYFCGSNEPVLKGHFTYTLGAIIKSINSWLSKRWKISSRQFRVQAHMTPMKFKYFLLLLLFHWLHHALECLWYARWCPLIMK